MTGRIAEVAGSVVDVTFEEQLPKIREALTVQVNGEKKVMEVAQHVGGHKVRCIMLSESEGLKRGLTVTSTGSGIKVPVGECTLGRLFNVLGDPIDGGEAIPEEYRHLMELYFNVIK